MDGLVLVLVRVSLLEAELVQAKVKIEALDRECAHFRDELENHYEKHFQERARQAATLNQREG